MNNVKISVIMSVYNAEITLKKCIESVLNQTFKDFEFIICDDCSTDSSKKILDYYSYDDRIILLKNNNNMRLAASLNKCLSVAKGKYIARVDADDYCRLDRFEIQYDFLEKNSNIDAVGSNMIVFDNNNMRIRKAVEFPQKKNLLKSTPFMHPTIMMRKNVYDVLNGYTVDKSTMRAEDLDLWFRFFYYGFNGYNIQDELYYYKEGILDYKKRTLEAAIETSKVFLRGYKLLNFNILYRIYCIKPIISALVPYKIIKAYHNFKDGEKIV